MKIKTLDKITEQKFCKTFSIQSYNSEKTLKEIHRHSFYQILILRKGSMRQFIDFEWKEVNTPCVSVIYPYQIHMLELSDDAETDIIMFDQSVYSSTMLEGELYDYNIDLQQRLNVVDKISENSWRFITTITDEMKSLYHEMDILKKNQILLLIRSLLLKTISIAPMIYDIKEIDRDLKYYQQFREALNHEFIAQKKVQDYSKELGISTKKLSIVCKKYNGSTPLELVHERLALELKKIVIEDGVMLKEIAQRLDFSSQPALNKFIERHFNSTPQKWKEQLELSMAGKI